MAQIFVVGDVRVTLELLARTKSSVALAACLGALLAAQRCPEEDQEQVAGATDSPAADATAATATATATANANANQPAAAATEVKEAATAAAATAAAAADDNAEAKAAAAAAAATAKKKKREQNFSVWESSVLRMAVALLGAPAGKRNWAQIAACFCAQAEVRERTAVALRHHFNMMPVKDLDPTEIEIVEKAGAELRNWPSFGAPPVVAKAPAADDKEPAAPAAPAAADQEPAAPADAPADPAAAAVAPRKIIMKLPMRRVLDEDGICPLIGPLPAPKKHRVEAPPAAVNNVLIDMSDEE